MLVVPTWSRSSRHPAHRPRRRCGACGDRTGSGSREERLCPPTSSPRPRRCGGSRGKVRPFVLPCFSVYFWGEGGGGEGRGRGGSGAVFCFCWRCISVKECWWCTNNVKHTHTHITCTYTHIHHKQENCMYNSTVDLTVHTLPCSTSHKKTQQTLFTRLKPNPTQHSRPQQSAPCARGSQRGPSPASQARAASEGSRRWGSWWQPPRRRCGDSRARSLPCRRGAPCPPGGPCCTSAGGPERGQEPRVCVCV